MGRAPSRARQHRAGILPAGGGCRPGKAGGKGCRGHIQETQPPGRATSCRAPDSCAWPGLSPFRLASSPGIQEGLRPPLVSRPCPAGTLPCASFCLLTRPVPGGLFSLLEEERRWPAAGSRNTRPPRGSRAIAYFTWLAEGGPQRRPGPEPWDLGVRPSLEGGLRRSDPMKDLAMGRRFWMFRAGPRVSHVSL